MESNSVQSQNTKKWLQFIVQSWMKYVHTKKCQIVTEGEASIKIMERNFW